MSPPPRLRLTRRFALTLVGGLMSVVIGLLAQAEALVVGGAMAMLLPAVGARAPVKARLQASLKLDHDAVHEDEAFAARADFEYHGRGRLLLEWSVRLPPIARAEAGSTVGLECTSPGVHTTAVDVTLPLFGLHRVGPLDWRAGDAFGFAFAEMEEGTPAEIRVYPKAALDAPVDVRSRQMRPLHGLHEVAQPGDGFEFFGLRDYQVGDRPRDINWKASAKYGHIYVNQHERESEAEVVLLVDARAATGVGPATRTPFAAACRAALAVAKETLSLRDRVRVVAYGSTLVEDRHTGAQRRLQGILDIIVGLAPEGDVSLRDVVDALLPSLRRRTPIVLFSTLVGDAGLVEGLTNLRSRDFPVHVYIVAPPASGAEPDATLAWRARQMQVAQELRGRGIWTHVARPAAPPPLEEVAAVA